jgi:hypothetical protein
MSGGVGDQVTLTKGGLSSCTSMLREHYPLGLGIKDGISEIAEFSSLEP